MQLLPLGERVLLKRKIPEKFGLIILPKGSQETRATFGEVVAIGDSCELLKRGDIITFGRYAPSIIDTKEFELYKIDVKAEEGTEYLILNECDALCIVCNDETKEVSNADESGLE